MKPHFKLSVQCQLPRHCALWKKLRAAWTRKRSWWDAESLDKGVFNSFVCRTFIQIYFLRFDALKWFYTDRQNWFYGEYHSNVHIKRGHWSCNCHSPFSPMKQSILMYDHQDVMKTFLSWIPTGASKSPNEAINPPTAKVCSHKTEPIDRDNLEDLKTLNIDHRTS